MAVTRANQRASLTPNQSRAQVPVARAVQEVVQRVLGEDVALFEDKANQKAAGGCSAFPWHQDYFYWRPPMATRDYPREIVTARRVSSPPPRPILPRFPVPARVSRRCRWRAYVCVDRALYAHTVRTERMF